MFKYRYNNSADYFNVSNTVLGRLDGAPEINYITVDKEFITSRVDFSLGEAVSRCSISLTT